MAIKKKTYWKNGDGTVTFRTERDLKIFARDVADKAIAEQTEEVERKTGVLGASVMIYTCALALQNLFGFGETRLSRFAAEVDRLLGDINEGLITLQDIEDYLVAGDFTTVRMKPGVRKRLDAFIKKSVEDERRKANAER